MKVLVADDDLMTRTGLEALISKFGCEVDVVMDGTTAFKNWRKYQVIIIDWNMPGMDGIDVVKKIRKQTQEYPPYIIMITATTSYAEHDYARRMGVNSVMAKPIDPVKLEGHLQFACRSVEKVNSDMVYNQKATI